MAEKLKSGSTASLKERLPEIAKRIEHVNERKEKAKEYNGLAGQATKDATENLNINKTAFTFIATCKRKEPVEQMDRLLTIFALGLGLGMLDQVDMFDDRMNFIREKLNELNEKLPSAPRGEAAKVVASLVAVN